ncbi:MAG TPA: formimidoylglutamate deiminase [Telluria sp.]
MGAQVSALFARHALLPDGWRDDVLLEWDSGGTITAVTVGAPQGTAEEARFVIPGMVNLHSHSFQRALGGMTEKAGEGQDSFWTWRELMYRFARRITPQQMEAIAMQLYIECLRHGYTSVCEFHYVQRDPNGEMYVPRPAETAHRVIAAARTTGIGITMLPVLYTYSGFGDQQLKPEQLRFRTNVRDVLRMIDSLECERGSQVEVGVAPHSLRAASIAQVCRLLDAMPQQRPVHIHIAEQQAEVEQSIAYSGRRPVRYLLDEVRVDQRWCLVHATHLDAGEIESIAKSGAVAGLCPTTEANLGDGLFPLSAFLEAGGRFGVGSDSHVSQSPVEELRWLEYGQRLVQQRRNVAVDGAERNVGDFLWQRALAGGAQATGRPVGQLAAGRRADLLVLDDGHPNLYGIDRTDALGAFIFSGNDNLVRHVMCGGQWVVRDGRHPEQDAVAQLFRETITELRRF